MCRYSIPAALLTSVILCLPLGVSAQDSQDDGIIEFSRPTPIRLIWLDAESAAKKLMRLFSDENGVKVCFDTPSNTVWVQANQDQIRKAKKYLEWVDEKGRRENYAIFVQLEHTDAVEAAQLINLILMVAATVDENYGIRVIPLQSMNKNYVVIASGTDEKMQQIKELILWLDARDK